MKKSIYPWFTGIVGLLCMLVSRPVQAQHFKSNIRDTIVNAKLLSFQYDFQLPAFDMAHRFGISQMPGFGFTFKVGHNFLLGLEGGYITGNRVKEDSILRFIRNDSNEVVGNNGNLTQLLLYESGFYGSLRFGKVFKPFQMFRKWNPNSGIMAEFGLGFMQHQIIIRDPENVVPEVHGEYAKGYDRLSNGITLSQFIGVLHLDTHRLKNFYAGINLIEGFTKVRRPYDFASYGPLSAQRFDMLMGLRAAWILPFYGRNEQRFYSY